MHATPGAQALAKEPTRVKVLHFNGETILRLSAQIEVSYEVVHPVRAIFDPNEHALAKMVGGRPILLAIDTKVFALYGDQIRLYARKHLHSVGEVLIEATEQAKAWNSVERVLGAAFQQSLPRNGVIAAVGGGVTLDIAGTAASLYRRGVGCVRIPTTLIGQVDAGVGIKQGVNFAGKKNGLGTFYPPVGTINDPRFLQTLPQNSLACGMAEMIKIALVGDAHLFESIEEFCRELILSRFQSPPDVARDVLLQSEYLMMDELQPNLYEHEMCRLVDLGHTFSPVMETLSDYNLPHGEAVASDMLLSTALANLRGYCDEGLLYRLLRIYSEAGLRAPLWPAWQLVEGLRQARLHRGGQLNLVVPVRPGKAIFLQDIDLPDLEEALKLLHRLRPEVAR
jgi:3-dehydroquinate synthetase